MAEVASYGPHFGEESVLVGENGSGTLFFCGCNLLCVFCQNDDISHHEPGSCARVDAEELAGMMVELQKQGCHNINFVTPSHVIPQILEALPHAIQQGLTVPLVYNSGGYDDVQSLELLEGVVDIFMPDFKFWSSASATSYTGVADYPEKACAALIEMQRQVGDLQIGDDGVAERGLLVRHLLMPDGMNETEGILHFIREQISVDCYINIMDQYRPCGSVSRTENFPELQKEIGVTLYETAVKRAGELGLRRLESKELSRLLKMLFKE